MKTQYPEWIIKEDERMIRQHQELLRMEARKKAAQEFDLSKWIKE